MKKLSPFRRFWNYYILGRYHCDSCPYCWSERTSYEYDEWDTGCYIKEDICDTCRLLPPFRWIIGYPKRRKARYYEIHQYDDFAEWAEWDHEKTEKLKELIHDKMLKDYVVCAKDDGGNYFELNTDVESYHSIYYECSNIVSEFEKFVKYHDSKNSRGPWKTAFKYSWDKFINKFKPYFCK